MRRHLAIIKREYLDLILRGEKTLECRLSRIACAPYERISVGEEVLLKESSGPVRGRAQVEQVEFFQGLTPEIIGQIRRQYHHEIKAEPEFWYVRRDCKYGSLIRLGRIEKIRPYRIKRSGLQAWVVLEE